MSSPRNVSTLGWIFESARPRTIIRMTLLQANPIARVKVSFSAKLYSFANLLRTQNLRRQVVNRLQFHDLHFAHATRNLDAHGVTHLLAEQTASDRRAGGDEALRHIHFLAGYQCVLYFYILVNVQYDDL